MDKVKFSKNNNERNLRKITLKKMDEGNYKISNEGHIISYKGQPKALKPIQEKGKKHTYVNLWKNNKPKKYNIEKLIKKYFPKQISNTPEFNRKIQQALTIKKIVLKFISTIKTLETLNTKQKAKIINSLTNFKN